MKPEPFPCECGCGHLVEPVRLIAGNRWSRAKYYSLDCRQLIRGKLKTPRRLTSKTPRTRNVGVDILSLMPRPA